ncbi:nuclear transport factor 2 family protein [Spirosoma pollinicola]|uniref:Nuclear transport factor 2 family protein n=2 Tax=Spirosoma pollinicola TaxID=2057025 RepID=A0A2K8ZCP6_9BACT|nr:nuclear transport factor 2 family protein [Spirosoma pollinicola]
MTEAQITAAVDELVALVAKGKPMDAFEKFYHNDIEKTDLDGITHQGKVLIEKLGHEQLANIRQVRDFSALATVIKSNRSFIVWSIDLDTMQGPLNVVEVTIQDWQDGQIIRERYFA